MWQYLCGHCIRNHNSHAAGEDFVHISNPVTLSANESAAIKVVLIDDQTFELTESFFVTLSYSDQGTPPPGLMLTQTSAEVIIFDNEGEFSVTASAHCYGML